LDEWSDKEMIAALMPSDLPRSDTGDHGAFVQATAELRPLVRAIVAAMLNEGREHPDVEDCTHEVMRRALEGRDRLREGEPIKPWVGGIARHVALDALRARKKQRQRAAYEVVGDDDSDHESAVDRVADTAPSPLENVEHAERQSALRRALETLPDGQRRALQMFHIEGLAYQEISSKLDVPLGTVATWVTRARKSVAEAIVREKMSS
jgi:RNA polymerase sigma-70 factor (ECF subfamily)